LQALFDVALITTVVHMTGGPESDFTGLYVLLIAATALLMRPTSTALVTILAGLVYFADVFFGHRTAIASGIWFQLGIFVAIAAEFWAALTATARRGVRLMRVEATVHRPDRAFPVGVTTTTLEGQSDAPPRVTAIFTDISDTKRLEELHLRAERLEAVAELSS